MALLTPNYIYEINGVTIKEKIIPDGTRWKDANKAINAGFKAGSLYKKQQKLSNGTGKVEWITIHNTDDLPRVEDDGEQYTRATYNENMGSARIHLYVDDVCAWQNLRMSTGLTPNDPVGSAEVAWHSGDGDTVDGGNMTSLCLEVVMNDNTEHDSKAYDNSARIAAWLLWQNGLGVDRLVTHTYWVNKSIGRFFNNTDVQCTTFVPGKKWCPTYIFKSTDHKTALANWQTYKALVQKYLDVLKEPLEPARDNVADSWAQEAIGFALENKILIGDGYGDYKLHEICTRQEMLVFLYRLYNLV